jgi:aspartyl protease family protein
MAMSSGGRKALTEAAMWFAAVFTGTLVFVYSDDIKKFAGLEAAKWAQSEPASSTPSKARSGEQALSIDSRSQSSGRNVRLAADNRGHFVTPAYVNGRPIDVMVDTGATSVALTWEDAQSAGVHVRESDFNLRVSTANGVTQVAPVTLDSISIGDIMVRDVQAVVARPGQLHVTLLGMSFLKKLDRVDIRGRELVLGQ